MPDTPQAKIEERWGKVRTWAKTHGTGEAPARALERLSFDVKWRWQDETKDGRTVIPRIERDTLSSAAREALEQFVNWQKSGAPFAPRECLNDDKPLRLYRLGRVSLYTASGAAELDQVEAVLALAQRMRRRGTLVDVAVSGGLIERAAIWSENRDVKFPPSFAKYDPQYSEIHGALARTALCSRETMAKADAPWIERHPAPPWGSNRPRPLWGLVRTAREARVHKDFHGRVLERGYTVRDDWRKLKQVYDEELEKRPKSLMLDFAIFYREVIKDVGEAMDKYLELRGSRGPKPD